MAVVFTGDAGVFLLLSVVDGVCEVVCVVMLVLLFIWVCGLQIVASPELRAEGEF